MTFFRNRRDDITDHTTPHGHDVRAESFEEEFARLLENSSLGTPNARAIQAMTTDEMVDGVHDRAEARARGRRILGDTTDIDDVLLDVVRSAAAPPESPQEPHAATATDERPVWQVVDVTCGTGGCLSAALLPYLIASRVYDYVRLDVARAIVDIVFRDGRKRMALLAYIGDRALVRSGVANDLALQFQASVHNSAAVDLVIGDHGSPAVYVAAETTVPPEEATVRVWDCPSAIQVNWARDCPDQDDRDSGWFRRGGDERAWEGRTAADADDSSDLTTKLAASIEQFLHGGPRSRIDARHPQCATREMDQITPIAGALLGLLHEGPQSSQILSLALCRRQTRPEAIHPCVQEELRALYQSGLVVAVNTVRMSQRHVRYRLTRLGQLVFHHWLLSKRDSDRRQVVLMLLSSVSWSRDMRHASRVVDPAGIDGVDGGLRGGGEAEDGGQASPTVVVRRILRNTIRSKKR